MTITPTPAPSGPMAWRPGDLEAIHIALAIPALAVSVRAINDAMASLEQAYPEAIPTAQAELAAIAALDARLAALTPEQLQAPIELRRKATIAGALTPGGELPVSKADVIEYATDLLREETVTRYGEGLSIEQALRRQRAAHAQALLLMLPALAGWSRDSQLDGSGAPYSAPMARG